MIRFMPSLHILLRNLPFALIHESIFQVKRAISTAFSLMTAPCVTRDAHFTNALIGVAIRTVSGIMNNAARVIPIT